LLDGRYRIGRVLGHGGFGITYLAWDANLYLRLAIKEYFPRDSAGRGADGVSLAVYSGPAAEQFAYGLDRFIEEARALARFDQHPGIVTVKNFFRAHGTGYCVMDFVEGITLRQYLDQQPGGKISVDAALKLLMPVADALRAVHKEGLLHRDIAPDNIYLSRDGRIKLLDFGAARYAAGEHSKSLSMVLKPGYSPEEQYRAKGKQGPWTDVYALGATVYRAITGTVPPESLDRLDQDDLAPPSRLGIAIAPAQEVALLKALAVKADQRWQDIAALQEGWRTTDARPAPTVAERHETATAQPVQAPPSTAGKINWLGPFLFVGAVLLLAVIFVPILFEHESLDNTPSVKPEIPPAPSFAPVGKSEVFLEPQDSDAGGGRATGGQGAAVPATKSGKAPSVQPRAAPAPGGSREDQDALPSWVIGVASIPTAAGADELVGQLRAGGFSAYVEQAEVIGKVTYRVKVGPELDRARAEKTAARLREKYKVNPMIKSYP
jgi:serine/threonine protein kinase